MYSQRLRQQRLSRLASLRTRTSSEASERLKQYKSQAVTLQDNFDSQTLKIIQLIWKSVNDLSLEYKMMAQNANKMSKMNFMDEEDSQRFADISMYLGYSQINVELEKFYDEFETKINKMRSHFTEFSTGLISRIENDVY